LTPRSRRASATDVPNGGPRLVGLDVHHQPHHPRHRPRDADLGPADQRHFLEAELAGRERGKLRREVAGSGKDHADDVVGGEIIARHDLGHQLGGTGQDLVPVVCPDLHRSPHCPHGHVLSLLRLWARRSSDRAEPAPA
jgi:hypothetical protein